MVKAVLGAVNPADIATKRLSSARVESLIHFLGLWCGSNNSLVTSWNMGPSKHLSSCQSPIKESGQTTDEYIERLGHIISVDTASGMYTNKFSTFPFAMDAVAADSQFGTKVVITWVVMLIGYTVST